MRTLAAIAVCLLLALPGLRGQGAHETTTKGGMETLFLFSQTVEVPPNDFRRARLPRLRKGATVQVKFHAKPDEAADARTTGASEGDSNPVGSIGDERESAGFKVEILRREELRRGMVSYRLMQPALVGARGELRFQTPDEGEYVVAVRQAGYSDRSARLVLQVEVQGDEETLAPAARTLSRERRIAVAVFSLGFLWTTLVVCGVPLIRAFRSRRRPPSPPWYA